MGMDKTSAVGNQMQDRFVESEWRLFNTLGTDNVGLLRQSQDLKLLELGLCP